MALKSNNFKGKDGALSSCYNNPMKKSASWHGDIIKEYGDKYIEVACPFLKDEKCSIYEKRPLCCKNYPHTNGYCKDTFCIVTQRNKNTLASSHLCSKCNSKCCKRILIPIKIENLSDEFFYKWLDINCESCNELFSEVYTDRLRE